MRHYAGIPVKNGNKSETLLNPRHLYFASIIPAYIVTIISAVLAYQSAGGSWKSLMASLSPKNSN
ncbi:UNVERIFIED_CONTAM: hypothetical protein NCL1_32235 [Trichonephila clavipes]